MTTPLPLPTTNDVGLYIRLTKEESLKKDLSAPAQRRVGTDYCKHHNWNPPHVYEEPEAVGGDIPFEKRKEARRLLDDIRSGKIKKVVTRDFDRLVRDIELWSQFKKLIRRTNVEFHTFSGRVSLDTAGDRFSADARVLVAQFEKDNTGDRVRIAKSQIAVRGDHPGGPPPFGYMMQATRIRKLVEGGVDADEALIQATREYELPGRLYVNESEAEVVREIFRLYVTKRLGCRTVAIKLNKAGHRRRSGLPWHPDKIRKILHSPVMAGYVGDQGKLHKGKHEALIDKDVWDKAQEILKRNRLIAPDGSANANKQYRFALSGIMQCRCGSPMRSKRTDKGHSYYVCQQRHQYGVEACNGPRVRTDKTHDALWSHLTPLFESKDCLDRVFAAVRKLQASREALKRKNVTIEQQIGKIEQDLAVWYERHDRAANDNQKEAAWTRIQALNEQKNQLIAESRSTPQLSVKPITRTDLAKDLARLSKLIRQSSDRGRGLIEALVQHHGLAVRLLDAESIEVSLRLSLPGSGATVPVRDVALLPKDRITAWLVEQRTIGHPCSECGKPVEIERRHFWKGIPTVHHTCMGSYLAKKKKPADGYTGCETACVLGVSRTTLGRMVKDGRLTPIRATSHLLVFDKTTVDRMARCR